MHVLIYQHFYRYNNSEMKQELKGIVKEVWIYLLCARLNMGAEIAIR